MGCQGRRPLSNAPGKLLKIASGPRLRGPRALSCRFSVSVLAWRTPKARDQSEIRNDVARDLPKVGTAHAWKIRPAPGLTKSYRLETSKPAEGQESIISTFQHHRQHTLSCLVSHPFLNLRQPSSLPVSCAYVNPAHFVPGHTRRSSRQNRIDPSDCSAVAFWTLCKLRHPLRPSPATVYSTIIQ